jgi:hypothetical protein
LADWVGKAAFLLRPLVEALGREVMSAERLFADDTPVPVLAPGHGKTGTGRLWVYVRDDRPAGAATPPAVLFRYTPDRKGDRPAEHLRDFAGALQADGYTGFDRLYRDGAITEVACWAHVRRKFHDVHVANASPIAHEALQRIGVLYDIEAAIRGRPPDERHAVRRARAGPLIEELRLWFDATLPRLSGKSDLAGAIRYARSRWPQLCRYCDDGRLEIDNNAAERALRSVALGRKNWLFAGSDDGASYCSPHHVIDIAGRVCCRSSGSRRRDRRAAAWRRTSSRSRSAWRMIQGPPLQCWCAGRTPSAIKRRTVEVLTARIAAASWNVASPRSVRSPSR